MYMKEERLGGNVLEEPAASICYPVNGGSRFF
jgi:hypothetical protein